MTGDDVEKHWEWRVNQEVACRALIPSVPAAGLEQVADSVVLGVPGNQRRSFGGEVVGGDALQARDFQSKAHRA